MPRKTCTPHDRCFTCGNEYKGNSTPRWLCGPDARLLGTIHTSCPPPPGHRTFGIDGSQDDAQWHAWLLWSGYELSAWMRSLFADTCQDDLSAHQWEALTRWVRQEAIGAREVAALVEEHREMVRAYRAWLADAPQVSVGGAG